MTNTPSEGTQSTGSGTLSAQEQLIAERVTRLVEIQMQTQARNQELRRRSLPERAKRIAPWAAVGAVGAATEPGQQVLGATGDAAVAAGQAVGHGAAEFGRGAAEVGRDVGQAASDAYNASVDQVQETAGDIAEGAGNVWNSAVDGAQNAWNSTVQAGGEALQWAGDRIGDMSSAVSGWAVETWHSAADGVTAAAHAVGAWGAQYADQIAANPGNAAVTAGLGAAAVVAASPQLRQSIGNAARAASRWGKEAVSAVAQKGRELAVGAALMYDNLRGMPDAPKGANPKETHAIVSEANAVTGGDRHLPSVAEIKTSLAPGHDPAVARAGSPVPKAAAQTGQATQGQGEAEHTGSAIDQKTKGGKSQGL